MREIQVKLSRRQFSVLLSGAAMSAVLTGCGASSKMAEAPTVSTPDPDLLRFASFTDNGYTIPEIPANRLDRSLWRQIVDDPFGEVPGTIIVDTPNRFLYLTLDNGQPCVMALALAKQVSHGLAVRKFNLSALANLDTTQRNDRARSDA